MRTAERRRLKREVARREIEAREEARRAYEHQMQMAAAAANYHSMYGYNAGNVGNVGANSYNVNLNATAFAPVADDGHAVAFISGPFIKLLNDVYVAVKALEKQVQHTVSILDFCRAVD